MDELSQEELKEIYENPNRHGWLDKYLKINPPVYEDLTEEDKNKIIASLSKYFIEAFNIKKEENK